MTMSEVAAHEMNTMAYDKALSEMYSDVPNVKKAFDLLEDGHRAGDTRATYALATWYLHGQDPVVQRDFKQAEALLKTAAATGMPDALYDLAVLYERGSLGEPDFPSAFRNYLSAAVRGDAQAVYEVGQCYHYGIGVAPDEAVADIWLRRAEELGITKSLLASTSAPMSEAATGSTALP